MWQSMLAWQRNGGSNTFRDKDQSEFVKAFKESLSGPQGCTTNCVPPKYVAEVHKCRQTLNHLRRHMTSNGSNIDLFRVVSHILRQWLNLSNDHTFINAFESSPVHCSKSLPSLKRRRPAYNGTAEILTKLEFQSRQVTNQELHTGDQYHVLSQVLDFRCT